MSNLFNSMANLFQGLVGSLPESKFFIAELRNAMDFQGRACRKEFLVSFVYHLCMGLIVAIISTILTVFKLGIIGGVIWGAYWIIFVIPMLSLWVRRLHDTNHSGLLLLLCLICCFIVPFIFALLDPVYDNNKYGEPSKLDSTKGYSFGSTQPSQQPVQQSMSMNMEQPQTQQEPTQEGGIDI